jgi:hypothetical protein
MSEPHLDQAVTGMGNDAGVLRPSSPNESVIGPADTGFIDCRLPLTGSIGMTTSETLSRDVAGFPEWMMRRLNIKPGRDPLGLQTITIDRVMPQLLPGILALSQRARYLSFYPFLLAEYQAHKLPPTNNALSTFIKAREYEYGLAVQLCPKGCGSRRSAVVGKDRVDPAVRSGADPQPRGESVQSFLGGYGLYYRSPLIDLQVVAPLGTLLAATPTPVDALRQDEWVTALAGHFGSAIRNTAYYKQYFWGTGPIPVAVLREYAEAACLCRLSESPAEQEAIRNALFIARAEWIKDEVEQRRRSFALFLRVLASLPDAGHDEGAFRRAIIDHAWPHLSDDTPEGDTSARWAALIMKEYMQEALSCIWTEVCNTGSATQGPDGMTRKEVQTLLRSRILPVDVIDAGGVTIQVAPDLPSSSFREAVAATRTVRLEDLRSWAVGQQTAIAGLVLLFATFDRLPDPATVSAGWVDIARQRSDNQPGLLVLWRYLQDHVQAGETLADTLEWLANRYIIQAHERIAYSKLPEFTFRFRWENGLLRFYNNGLEQRFELANIRRNAVAQMSQDLGLWADDGSQPTLTPLGETFVHEVFE